MKKAGLVRPAFLITSAEIQPIHAAWLEIQTNNARRMHGKLLAKNPISSAKDPE